MASLIKIVRDETDKRLPQAARFALSEIAGQIEGLTRKIGKLEHAIVMEAKRDDDMRRLCTIPGIGAIIAASIKAMVPDPGGFTSGRHFAAWLRAAHAASCPKNPDDRQSRVIGVSA